MVQPISVSPSVRNLIHYGGVQNQFLKSKEVYLYKSTFRKVERIRT